MLSCGLDGHHGSLRFPNIVSVFFSFRPSEWETKAITVLSRNGTNGSDSKNSDWRSQPDSNNIHLCNTCGTHQTHVQGMLLILWKVWMIEVKWILLESSPACVCLHFVGNWDVEGQWKYDMKRGIPSFPCKAWWMRAVVAQWWEHSPSISVAWVLLPDSEAFQFNW